MPTPLLDEQRLADFDNEELFKLLQLEEWTDLEILYSEQRYANLLALAQHKLDLEAYLISQSFVGATNNASIYPIYFLWAVVEKIKLSAFALSVLTGIFGIITILVGSLYFYQTHRQLKEEADEADQFFKLHTLKLKVAEVLIERLAPNVQVSPNQQGQIQSRTRSLTHSSQPRPTKRQPKHLIPDIRQPLETGMLSGTTFLGTFLGISTLVIAFKLTMVAGAMLGPYGLPIMLAAGACLAIYFGYKHYCAIKKTDYINEQRVKLANDVEYAKEQCNELRPRVTNNNVIARASRPASTNALTILYKKIFSNPRPKPKNQLPISSAKKYMLFNNSRLAHAVNSSHIQPKPKPMNHSRFLHRNIHKPVHHVSKLAFKH